MKTLVLGIGNTITGDDAAGVVAAEILQRMLGKKHTGVDIDVCTYSGTTLLPKLAAGYDKIIIIDAVRGLEKGRLVLLGVEDIGNMEGKRKLRTLRATSAHDMNLSDLLLLLEKLDSTAVPDKIIIYGIGIGTPQATSGDDYSEFSEKISKEVRTAAERAAALILEDLNTVGGEKLAH